MQRLVFVLFNSVALFLSLAYTTNNYYRFVVAVPNVRTPTPLKTFLWYEKSHWPDKKKGPLDGGGFAIRESLTREINEMITLDKKKSCRVFFSKSYFVEMLVMTHSGHQMCYLVCAVLQVLIHTNYKLFTSLNFRTKLQRMEKEKPPWIFYLPQGGDDGPQCMIFFRHEM